jgi:hypothetical protein
MTKPSTKQQKSNRTKDLILLFAAPVVVILLAVALVYTPRLFANPSYDFVYSSCASYSCSVSYRVESDGKLDIDQSDTWREPEKPTLYYFDTSENNSTRIDESQAFTYSLIGTQKSPDEYRLSSESGSGFLFWDSGSDGKSWYLADGLKKKHINLQYDANDYSDVNLIGWIKQ